MTVFFLRLVCAIGAFLCGVRALGYWAILQVGNPRPADRDGIALVLWGSAFLFVILSAASAYLRERASGARAVAAKTLFFTGAYGLPCIGLFGVASRGAVLKMPEVTGLLILFVCFVLVFRPLVPKRAQ